MKDFKDLKTYVLTFVIILIIMLKCSNIYSQSRTGKYLIITTDHYKAETYPKRSSSTILYKSGTINVDLVSNHITVDDLQYDIVEKQKDMDKADEDYYTKSLSVVFKDKKGKFKIMDVVLLIKPDGKTIDEVIFKKTKSTNISYQFAG